MHTNKLFRYRLSFLFLILLLVTSTYAHMDQANTNKIAQIDLNRVPRHVGIIMDGNGRWGKLRGQPRIFGHQNSTKAVSAAIEGCAELGIQYLTVYAFSTENFGRPAEEVKTIIDLMATHLEKELETLIEKGVRIRYIGGIEKFPVHFQKIVKKATEVTKNNTKLHVTVAVNYGGRAEIVNATKEIVKNVQKGVIHIEDIDDKLFSSYLYTCDIPDPDLLIRTSGEMRLSGFLTWQSSYSELYFLNTLWPDFTKSDLHDIIINFQKRERRFGKLSTTT